MADKIKLLELDIDTASIIAKSVQLKKDLDDVRASVSELKKAGDTSSETFITQSAQISKLSTEYNLNQKQLTNLVTASGTLLTASEKANAILGIEATTVTEASNQNKELLKIRNEINAKTPEGVIAIGKLNEKIDENTNFIRTNVSDIEKQRMNIGNYTDAINNSAIGTSIWGSKLNDLKSINDGLKNTIAGAKEELKKHAETIKEFTKGTEGMTTAQKASTIATNVGSGAMNIFKVALASTGVGLLVLALASLIGYFTQTQSGIDKLNSVLQPLKAIFTALSGIVFTAGEKIVDAFSNPKKSMNDLYEFVKQNLINRFTAFAVILDGIVNMDFKKVSNGMIQAGTGVENAIDKAKAGAEATGKFLEDNAKKGKQIAQLTIDIENAQNNYNKSQRETGDLIDAQLLISKDTSRSMTEREKASREIIKLTKELGKEEENIVNKKIQQLTLEQSLKKEISREDKAKMEELKNQKEDAGDRGIEAEKEQMKVISGFKKEANEKAKELRDKQTADHNKAVDDAIAKTKQEVDNFIASQGFRKKSLEEEMIFERQLVEEKQALLKQQLDTKRISETEYKTENLNLTNEYGLKLAEMLSQNAEDEMKSFLENNQSKLDANKYLTDEMVTGELDRFNRVSEAEAEYQTKRLELGLINEREYKEAIKTIDEEYATNKKALEDLKLEEDTAKAIVDAENLRASNQLDADNDFADKYENLERQRIQEEKTAEKTGADVTLINKKYATLKKTIDKDLADYKLNQEIGLVRGLRGLVGEQTVLGKALAVADIAMTTVQGATKMFQKSAAQTAEALISAASYDYVGAGMHTNAATMASVQGGIIIATGVAQTAKVLGLRDGAVDIDGPGNETSDSIPAMISKGESVINAKSTAQFKPLLQAINEGNGYNYLTNQIQMPNIYSNSQSSSSGTAIDYDLLASKIGTHVGNANLNLPAPNLSLDYFHRENAGYTNLLAGANHG